MQFHRSTRQLLAGGALALLAANAGAVIVNETGDFAGGASFDPFGESNIGPMSTGINLISGSLAGTCDLSSGCNGASAGDTQDSFQIEIAPGQTIAGIYIGTGDVSGPLGFSASMVAYKDSFANNVLFEPSIPLNAVSGMLALSDNGDGKYSISVYGQGSSEPGAYSLDYTVQIDVSAVPLPAAAWLFGSSVLGLIGLTRARRIAG